MQSTSMYLLLFMLAGVASWYVMPRKWLALLSFLSRSVSGFRSHTARVEGIKWRYMESGKGQTLIILHGMAAEADHWLGVAGQLRRHFHILVPDLPGFGSSEPPGKLDFHIAAQADRLEAWLDQLGINDCILAGNSMGAWISAEFASRHPGRVKALWLQDPFGVMSAPPSEILAGLAIDGNNPFRVESMDDYRSLIALMFFKPPHLPYPIARAGYLNTLRLKEHMPRIQTEVIRESAPLETLAPILKMPVLIEWGIEDRAVNVAGAEILTNLLAESELVIRNRVGHLPMLECPNLSAASFLKFANEHGLVKNAT